MDTASVGVATYDPARGWLRPGLRTGSAGKPAPVQECAGRRWCGLLGISRELVEPDSLPEFERLQHALRQGQRAEVRYAVRHPELGAAGC
jgi:hypothetical protein